MSEDKIEYYVLTKRELEIHPLQLVTAAVWSCVMCNETISGMGGPGWSEICVKCGDDIIHGRMKYVRDKNNDKDTSR